MSLVVMSRASLKASSAGSALAVGTFAMVIVKTTPRTRGAARANFTLPRSHLRATVIIPCITILLRPMGQVHRVGVAQFHSGAVPECLCLTFGHPKRGLPFHHQDGQKSWRY